MEIKVSVVVPVYNVEQYLPQCLDCLERQTLDKALEVILVDDGSTDGSGKICDDIAMRDSRFRVIHRKNGGTAAARQSGWDIAQGEYITVCDADDWVEPDMYELMYAQTDHGKVEMVTCDIMYNYSNGNFKVVASLSCESGTDFLRAMQKVNTQNSTCNKLIKRNLFDSLTWNTGINLGEDALMLMKILLNNPTMKIAHVGQPLYHYRRRIGENTCTHLLSFNKLEQMVWLHKWKLENLKEIINTEGINKSAIDMSFAALRVADITPASYKAIIGHYINVWSIMRHNRCLKAVIAIMPKFIGVRLTQKLLKLTYRFFYI
jgi:glycosyltransferase involved in cell wall biosynthesis